MRSTPNAKVERYRVRIGALRSNSTFGNNGAFQIPHPSGVVLMCIISDGKGWEHVSVQTFECGQSRIPTWNEMAYVKQLFFEDHETAIEYHVPKARHLNLHASVLHLWRPLDVAIPLPPSQMVAPKDEAERRMILNGEPILK